MKLPLSPDMLRAAYAYLAETAPFNKWNMPPAEDVKFKVLRGIREYGDCDKATGMVRISSACHSTTDAVMRTMAHEMVHVFMYHHKIAKRESEHGRVFWKYADQVCAIHGFDRKAF